MDVLTRILRKAYRATHPIFGVQPMVAPVCSGLTLRYVYGEEYTPETLDISSKSRTLRMSMLQFISRIDEGHVFDTVGDAEDYFIKRYMEEFPPDKVDLDISNDPNCESLLLYLGRQALRIAIHSRRGKGNIVVVNNKVFSALKRTNRLIDDEWTGHPFLPGSNLIYSGKSHLSLKIFIHKHWGDDHPALVAYKGESEVDTSVFLMPAPGRHGRYKLIIPEIEDKREDLAGTWSDYFGTIDIGIEDKTRHS